MISPTLRSAASIATLAALTLGAATLVAPAAVAEAAPAISWLGSDFNNTGIGDRATSNANIDGGGGFLLRDLLPAAGLPSGTTLTLPADPSLGFVLGGVTPGQADNVVGTGQTLNSSVALGSAATTAATKIAFVGTATIATQQDEPVTLQYSDGSQQNIAVTLTDWCSGSGASGNVRFGAVTDRWYAGAEDTGTQCGLWSTTTYALSARKKLDGIVLPVDSRLHIFAIASDAVGGDATLTASTAPSVAPAGGTAADTSVRYAGGALALATDAAWAVSGVATSYQWYADGSPIANATSRAYTPRIGDIGSTLAVVATGRKSGYGSPGTSVSNGIEVDPGALSVVTEPTIDGTPRVGDRLTLVPGTYSPADADETYQWFAGDAAILGETGASFTPGASMVGASISATTTVTRPGYAPLARIATAASVVAPVAPVTAPGGGETPPAATPVVQAASVPVISGTAKVGSLLSARTAAFTPADVSVHYQWLRAGRPIAGAVAPTYRAVAADRGHALSLIESAERLGYVPLTVASKATAKVAYGTISLTKKSTITGTARVGAKLTVTVRTPSIGGTHTTVRWLRAGKPISHATSRSYRLVGADRGKKITVRVSIAKSGYTTRVTSVSTKKVK